MSMRRQIILDTETTGLSPKSGHKIIEFAGLEMKNRQLTGQYLHLYINPEREIDADAEKVHGISLAQLEGKPIFKEIGQQLASFLKDAELIIHNAPFDVGFLNHEFAAMGLPDIEELTAEVIDTLPMARKIFPGKRASLDALCDRFEIDRSNRTLHGALVDCELLAEVYLALTRGQHTLDMEEHLSAEDLAQIARARPKDLVILKASTAEIAEHELYLVELDKASGNQSLYRQLEDASL